MKLEPGLYKIKYAEDFFDSEVSHYLRVFYKDGILYYQEDHDKPREASQFDDSIFLGNVKTVQRVPEHKMKARNVRVTFSWEDLDGDKFSLTGRSRQILRRIVKLFPWVNKELG